MTQQTILAPGQTAATSSGVMVESGQTVKIGMYVATGKVPHNVRCAIVEETPGADQMVGQLGGELSVVIAGPGTYKVERPWIGFAGVDVGVFAEVPAAE